ncbi:MAG: hypothetical protein RIB45_01720 [Marivibrio sp.]|uniref:hypothetical protein n=1 Tax=Marivibrio sp. TaxID=2039719 RepID=UPI0032EB83AC
MTQQARPHRLKVLTALIGVSVVALVAPPLAASAGVGPEDRRAVLVYSPFAPEDAGWRATLAAGGRPIAARFGGRLVLAAYGSPDARSRFRESGALLLLDAALLERCGAF